MSETAVVVGVDAGGSKTRVLIATGTGEHLAEMVGAGAAMSPGNADHCAGTIATLVASALAQLAESDNGFGAHELPPRVLVAGVAGAGRETEQTQLRDALMARAVADEVVVVTDAEIALEDAFGAGAGIVLISGTGSIAFGRAPAGVFARCGGWGPGFGDEGSGTWIGRRALSVVAAAHDGREPETALTDAILIAAQVSEPEQLIPWAMAADRESVAALAPTVIAIALQDDVRANSIIDTAAEELVLHIRALATRLFMDERAGFSVALAGGLLGARSLLRKRLERRMRSATPGAQLRSGEIDAARGAVKRALRVRAAQPSVV